MNTINTITKTIIVATALLALGGCASPVRDSGHLDRSVESLVKNLAVTEDQADIDAMIAEFSKQVVTTAYSAPRTYRASRTYGRSSCNCNTGRNCFGPRGGRYCITSGGNKRYR